MNRRRLLRSAGGLAFLSIPSAGCTGRSGDGTESPTRSVRETDRRAPSDANGTARSTVAALEIGDTTPFVAAPLFGLEVTVTNTGDRETEAFRYEYQFTLTTEDGTGADRGGPELFAEADVRLALGESVRFVVREEVDGDPSAVTGYDLTLTCSGTSRGVYCES